MDGCLSCETSIVKVYDSNTVTKDTLLHHMMEGCAAEQFHTIWRNVEIVGSISLKTKGAEAVRKYCMCQASIKTTGVEVPAELVQPF